LPERLSGAGLFEILLIFSGRRFGETTLHVRLTTSANEKKATPKRRPEIIRDDNLVDIEQLFLR